MTLQRGVNFRSTSATTSSSRITCGDALRPGAPFHGAHIQNPPPRSGAHKRVEQDAIRWPGPRYYFTLWSSPWRTASVAIDFMNPSPDADRRGVGEANSSGSSAPRAPRGEDGAGAAAAAGLPLGCAAQGRGRVTGSAMNTPAFTIGIEEEYQTIDPVTYDLRSHIQTEIVAKGQRQLNERVKAEMHQSVVEVGTGVCRSIKEASDDLRTCAGTAPPHGGERVAPRVWRHAPVCRLARAGKRCIRTIVTCSSSRICRWSRGRT